MMTAEVAMNLDVPDPQDKIQHLDFIKDPRPPYYKTPPCVLLPQNVRSKAVFGP